MRNTRRSALAAALAVATTAGMAAPAHAVSRYVTPTSGTTTCIVTDPCDLATALANSAPGDTVYLGGGTYTLSSTLAIPDGVAVWGTYGQARPGFTGTHGLKLGPAASLRYAGIITTGAGQSALELDGATARDVVAISDGDAETAVILRNNTANTLIQDAVVMSKVKDTFALKFKDAPQNAGGTTTVLATTVVGLGEAKAIKAEGDVGTQAIINTVAWGRHDIDVKTGSTLYAWTSNFRPAAPAGLSDQGGNQTAKPCWMAADDVRPLSTSPTVDAGYQDNRLSNDPWGVSRTPADIGGLEYQPSNDIFGTDCIYPTFDPIDPPDDTDPGDDGGSSDPGTGTGGGNVDPPQPPPGEDPKPDPPVTTTGGGGTTTTEQPSQLPPAAPPVLNTTVTVGESKGTVLIRLPGSNTPVPLTADATIPVGAVIDATNGTVELTSATDANGKTQTGQFWGAQFKVKQTKDRYTELVLTGSALDGCKTRKNTKAKKRKKGATRSLWGRDRGGRFRTRGRNGTATVRGTRWLTEDSCDGTLFRVTQGAIDVRDDVDKRTIRLKAGDRYFADNTPAKRKKKPKK